MIYWRSSFSIFSIFATILISLSVSNLFSFWVSIELNMLTFLLFLSFEESPNSMMKYFIVQAFSSSVLMWAFFLSMHAPSQITEFFVLLSFLVKIAAAPFHMWMMNFIKSINWSSIIIFASLQKMIPLYAIFCFIPQQLKMWIAILCLITATHGTFNSFLLKPLIGFSSIFAIAWMISSETFLTMMLYLLFYFVNLLALTTFLEASNSQTIMDFNTMSSSTKKLSTILILLSMAGIPPLIGFLSKIFVIWDLLLNSNYFLFSLLILFSLFILTLYIRISVFFLTLSSTRLLLLYQEFPKIEMMIFLALALPVIFLLLSVKHKKIWFSKL